VYVSLVVDARVSAMFTAAVTAMLDDCSDWPIVVIATTTSRSSLNVSVHDLFVHCTDIDVRVLVSVPLCLSLSVRLSVCLLYTSGMYACYAACKVSQCPLRKMLCVEI